VSRSDERAPGDPRRRGIWPGWYLIVLGLVFVFFGWVPVLMLVLAALCVGFVLTQQKREERRRDGDARSNGPRAPGKDGRG
jgi:hypothetical protein